MNSAKRKENQLIFPTVSTLNRNDVFGWFIEVNILSNDTKICSFNCNYCELGENIIKINSLKNYNYNSPITIINELEKIKNELILKDAQLDTLLISGNGEPTLHPQFSEVSKSLKLWLKNNIQQSKLTLLTNGAHFQTKKSVANLDSFDEVFVKLDTLSDLTFKKMNNPLVRVNPDKVLHMSQRIENLCIQSMFVTGAIDNTTADHVAEYLEVIAMLKPKRILLETLKQNINGLTACQDVFLYNLANMVKKKTDSEVIVNL